MLAQFAVEGRPGDAQLAGGGGDVPLVPGHRVAHQTTFGRPPVFMREGGSIPVVSDFEGQLGLPTVLMGFGLPGDHIHSPNERFYLPNFDLGAHRKLRGKK